jgi:hypothetical protein
LIREGSGAETWVSGQARCALFAGESRRFLLPSASEIGKWRTSGVEGEGAGGSHSAVRLHWRGGTDDLLGDRLGIHLVWVVGVAATPSP